MKKIWLFTVIIALFVIMAACSADQDLGYTFDPDGKNIVTLASGEDDYVTEVTYEAEGDKVKKQITRSEASYEQYGVSSKASAEVAFNEVVEQYQSIEGLDYEIEFLEEEVKQLMTIDFEVVDPQELNEIPGVEMRGNVKKGISLKETVKVLQEQGYQVVDSE